MSRPARFLLLAFITACILALAIGYLDAQEPRWVWVPGKGRVMVDRTPKVPKVAITVFELSDSHLNVALDCPGEYRARMPDESFDLFQKGSPRPYEWLTYLRANAYCAPFTPNDRQYFLDLRRRRFLWSDGTTIHQMSYRISGRW